MEPDTLATAFTPWRSLAGGVPIGLAAVALMALHGRVAGVSGIVRGALTGPGRSWRVAFVAGLVAGLLLGGRATAAVPGTEDGAEGGAGRASGAAPRAGASA